MQEYISILSAKIRSYDKRLRDLSYLHHKTWVRVTLDGRNEKWFFRNNGVLTISLNGDVIEGKYDHLEDYLMIEILNRKVLLDRGATSNEMLILKKDVNDSEIFAFYDNAVFTPDSFNEHLINTRKTDLNIKVLLLVDQTEVEVIREEKQRGISMGNSVLMKGELIDKPSIETKTNYYDLRMGVITDVYYKRTYRLADNRIVIKQRLASMSIKDTIVFSEKNISDGLHRLLSGKGIEIKDNKVKKIFSITNRKTLLKNRCLEIWSGISGEYCLGDLVMENRRAATDGKYWIGLFEIITVKSGKIN